MLANSNSNSTFIALNLCQKTDSKAHHTKTLFNIHKPESPLLLLESEPRNGELTKYPQNIYSVSGCVCSSMRMFLSGEKSNEK